ncbi:TPA: hypothetical protein I9749_004595 [Serratia marcescens]|nr:hypothetical protein [Serratia marcescens]
MESFDAIKKFMDTHQLQSDQFGHLKFEAFVEYQSPSRNAVEVTNVKILRNGYDDGTIKLHEEGDLVADDYHLDFTPQYQNYSFSINDGNLIITGTSAKMGGKYNVTISPK